MNDIKLHETCVYCGGHMVLREIEKQNGNKWLVKACPLCGGVGPKDFIRLYKNNSGKKSGESHG